MNCRRRKFCERFAVALAAGLIAVAPRSLGARPKLQFVGTGELGFTDNIYSSPEDPVPGDPNAITCRLDPQRSDRQLSAVACARRSYWVWYKAKWGDPLSSTPAPP